MLNLLYLDTRMKSIQIDVRKLGSLLVLLVASTVSACSSTPLTPSQTAQHFWSAAISGDLQSAKEFSTSDSAPEVKKLQDEFTNASVSFGKVNIEPNQARIDTVLTINSDKPDEKVATNFETFLDKQDRDWKVNYPATKKSLENARQKKGLSKLTEDLRKFGSDISGQMEGVIKHWEEVTPEIKKDLEELGNSVQNQLQDSIDKHGPELQKKLQDFTESLDDAIKDLQKSMPKEKRKEPEDKQEPKGRLI